MRPATTIAITILTLLLLVLLQSGMAEAKPLTVENIFQPLEYLHIDQIYERYSALIDFLIFTLIFVGLAQTTVGRTYAGAGGRAISIGVGLALAIGMLLAETRWEFNLKLFGPFAALLTVLVLGVTVFGVLRHAGAFPTTAASIAYLMIFVAGWAVAPDFFQWLNDTIPIIAFATIMGVMAALGGTFYGMAPHMSRTPKLLAGANRDNARRRDEQRRFLREVQTVGKKAIRPITRSAVKEADAVQNTLGGLRRAIQRAGDDPAVRQRLIDQVRAVAPQEHALRQDIHNFKELNWRVLKLDETLVHESYRARLRTLSPQERQQLTRKLRDELARAEIEKKVQQIEATLSKRCDAMARHIEASAVCMEQGDKQAAVASLGRAIQEERAIQVLTREVKALEKRIIQLIGHEIWQS